MTAIARPPRRRTHPAWLAPTGLILLSLIPIVAGAVRLTELTGGAEITPRNARFLVSPIPVVTHIVSVTVYSVFGALQFVPALRRHSWHRISGRVLVPAGLLAALSGMWMAVFYALPAGDGAALLVLRLLVGSAMVAGIVLGFAAALRRDFVSHSGWMTRAYAIGVAAGTQAILLIPAAVVFGPTHELSRAVFMGAAWVMNLAIAEYVIRRRSAGRRARAKQAGSSRIRQNSLTGVRRTP